MLAFCSENKGQEMGQKLMRGADWLAKKAQGAAVEDGGGGGGVDEDASVAASASAAAAAAGDAAGAVANKLKMGFRNRLGKGKSSKNFKAEGFFD